MDKLIILNTLYFLLLLVGMILILLSTLSPRMLVDVNKVKINGECYIVRDKMGLLRFSQKLHFVIGFVYSLIGLFAMLHVINGVFFGYLTSMTIMVWSIVNARAVPKYI